MGAIVAKRELASMPFARHASALVQRIAASQRPCESDATARGVIGSPRFGTIAPARLINRTGVQHHKGCVRIGWSMVRGDGTVAAEGESIGVLATDGRLERVFGFRTRCQPCLDR
ncbi:MAG: hypothetical protein ACHREM_17405 [Polyangiales bacterium]